MRGMRLACLRGGETGGCGRQGIWKREDIRNDGQSLFKWQLLAWPTEIRFNLDCNESSQEVFGFQLYKGIPFCFTEFSLVARHAVIPSKGQN